jgi:cytidylate kinase
MPVITISRQLGSLGTEIARQLSNDLQCNYLDKESLEMTFGEHGIPKESVERYDEKKPGFWDIFKTDKARYLHFMKEAIFSFAHKGNCVILGRGGQVVLGGIPGVLNVRVVAPAKNRIERIMKRFECDERHAEKIILHNDHERAGFHKFFFDCNWEDAGLYDLVINTGFFSVETAAELIENAVSTAEFKAVQEDSLRQLTDLSLAHEVKTYIVYKEKVSVQFLEVEAHQGVVSVGGIVADEDDVERSGRIIASIPGVTEVKNEIFFKPITTSYGLHYL